MSLTSRAKRYLRARGVWATARQVPRFLWRKAFGRENAVVARRRELCNELFDRVDGVVQAGPLKGFRLSSDATWGAADRGPMLLGFYEASVTAQIEKFSTHASTLIDIGAADGYFGVGVIASELYARSICFELDPVTCEAIAEVARLNNVAERVTIFGAADSSLLSKLADAGVDLSDAVVLCDIEGGEFGLFNDALLAELSRSRIIIELHDGMLSDGAAQLAHLAAAAERHFDVSYLTSGPRDPGAIPLLQAMSEDDRWLLCSEGRNIYQRWMVLVPRT